MAYKLLGYAVWHGGKWYVRRRYAGAGRKAAVAALAGGLIFGGVAVKRAASSRGA
jgi:hypothetical protein